MEEKQVQSKSGLGKFIGLGVFACIFVTIFMFGFGALSFRNKVVSLQVAYEKQYEANQTSYDSMWKKFKEMYGITEAQADQYKDVYGEIVSGRYDGDANVAFKAVAEQNPQMADVYTSLQATISADRDTFNNEQKKVVDKVGTYNEYIRTHFIYNTIFNFPVLDLSDFTVTSERTEEAYSTGKDDEIKFGE